MTGTIEVLLHIPAEIAAGLADGTLVRRGSIVWEAASGRVRAQLREDGTGSQFTEDPPPRDSIREFFYLNTNDDADRPLFNRLNVQLKLISQRLHEQEITLTKIIENLDLMHGFQQAMLNGAISAALELAERGEDGQDSLMVRQAWAELMKGREQLGAFLESWVRDSQSLGQALRAHKMFALLLCRYHLAARAVARCEWLLYGADAASQAASRARERITALRAGFLAGLRNFVKHQQVLVEFDADARQRLRQSVRDFLAIERESSKQIGELEFCAQAALTPATWRELTQSRPRVLLLRDPDHKMGLPANLSEAAK